MPNTQELESVKYEFTVKEGGFGIYTKTDSGIKAFLGVFTLEECFKKRFISC